MSLVQYYIREFRPKFLGLLTKLFYSGSGVKIGFNFKTDGVPKILLDKGCSLVINDNVEFRRNVEIRVHKKSHIFIDNNVRVDRGVRILASNNSTISISEGVRIGLYTVLNGGDSIYIGEKSLISGFVYLQTSMHSHDNKLMPVQDQGFRHASINLERNTWIGTHAVIMPGVTLGEGAIVGSNAVVTKSVESFETVVGIPARALNK